MEVARKALIEWKSNFQEPILTHIALSVLLRRSWIQEEPTAYQYSFLDHHQSLERHMDSGYHIRFPTFRVWTRWAAWSVSGWSGSLVAGIPGWFLSWSARSRDSCLQWLTWKIFHLPVRNASLFRAGSSQCMWASSDSRKSFLRLSQFWLLHLFVS